MSSVQQVYFTPNLFAQCFRKGGPFSRVYATSKNFAEKLVSMLLVRALAFFASHGVTPRHSC